MMNILLATDFSINAHTAAFFAGEITRLTGGRLIIFYALPPVFKVKVKGGRAENFLSEKAAQKKMDKVAYELRNKFGISVSRLIKPGFAEDEILELAERLKAAVILLGATGDGTSDAHKVGSVAVELLSKSHLPVICVPQGDQKNLEQTIADLLGKQQELCNEEGLEYLRELKSNNRKRTTTV